MLIGREVGAAKSAPRRASADPGPRAGAGAETAAERAHKKRLDARAADDVKKTLEKSHRERVDELNSKLSNLTEHNDIPRISAAGNG